MKLKVLVLGGYGINCETETTFAFERAGAEAEYVHVNDLIDGYKNLDDYQILAFPGGFSFGDHIGSGKALANRLFNNIGDKVLDFVKRDTLTIGICNGFQVLVALGLLPALEEKYGERQAGLLANDSNRFICRYIHLKNTSKKCVWTKGIDQLYMPVSHGEGAFYLPEKQLDELKKNDQQVFVYTDENGKVAGGKFPVNPNGAVRDIAGICDPSGRIFGLMPHPERALFFCGRPDFTLQKELLLRSGKEIPEFTENMKVFENAVRYFN